MKPKVAIFSLTACSGCISTLISLNIFPQFLERSKISNFSFISDIKEIESSNIALIEGCISEDSQIKKIKEIRTQAKKVYALGTCASFGGILNLSNVKKAEPISNYIEIDGIIPGCPPPSKLLGNCLLRMIENKNIDLSKKNMCANCPLKGDLELTFKTNNPKIYLSSDQINLHDESSECFLNKGILCLGPITRDGCDHRCIEYGVPCEGCMGPVSKDFTSNLINFLSLVNLSDDLKNYKAIFYRFSKPKLMGG